MTPDQATLLKFLCSGAARPAAEKLQKRTAQQFVLAHGWWYEPLGVPDTIASGSTKECHKNAVDLTMNDPSLVYCEGYALFKSGSSPTIHAWVTDGRGKAIDNTWPQPGVAYAGIPFTSLFVSMTALKNNAIISLLDDYMNDWPLLGHLGDRPEEWFEVEGRGLKRVDANEADV